MNEIGELDRLILEGVSMGFKSPRKLSEKINIDQPTIRSRIKALSKDGYICDTDKNVPLMDRIIASYSREEDMSCGRLTNKGGNALGEESIDYILANIKHEKGIIKHTRGTYPSKLLDGFWYGLGCIGVMGGALLVAIIAIVVIVILLVIALLIFVF